VTGSHRADATRAAKWSGLLGPRDLQALEVEDFEVIDRGAALPFGYNCVRKQRDSVEA
jgi:hypothetical protein